MARLNATALNFSARGQVWSHFWWDAAPTGGEPPVEPQTVRRYYRGRQRTAGAVMLSKNVYYVDEEV